MYGANYGVIFAPNPCATAPALGLTASQVFSSKSGKFVYKDTSTNYLTIADSTTAVMGWAAVEGAFTSSSTAGADKVPVIVDLTAIFEIPCSTTLTAATLAGVIFETCDIVVSSNIQYGVIGTSTYDVIWVVGGNVEKNTLHVMLNPNRAYTSA